MQIRFHIFFSCIFFLLSIKLFSQEVKPISIPIKVDTINTIVVPDSSTQIIKEELSLQVKIPDTVFLFNGDKFTGNILSFEQGRLNFDAQGPGEVYLKWHKIKSIHGGNTLYKVEDYHGNILIGRIAESSNPGEIIIRDGNNSKLPLENLVRIFPLESKWYRKFKGDLSAGVSYTKSSEVLTINSDYNIYYVISKWRFINDFSYTETNTENDDKSIRFEFNLQAIYALHKKWVLYEKNTLSRNDELGIKSRISFGVGGGNSIVQTERQRLLLLSGIVQNSEKDIETNNTISNFEWPFYIQHSIFSFTKPNLTSTTSISSFVGITEKGRYRIDFSTDIIWELVSNFDIKLSFYYNFDNKNVEGKESKEDHGTVLSLVLELK